MKPIHDMTFEELAAEYLKLAGKPKTLDDAYAQSGGTGVDFGEKPVEKLCSECRFSDKCQTEEPCLYCDDDRKNKWEKPLTIKLRRSRCCGADVIFNKIGLPYCICCNENCLYGFVIVDCREVGND